MSRFAPRVLTLALALGLLVVAPIVVAQTPGLTDHPAWEPDNPRPGYEPPTEESTVDEPATIAERLFVATLDRFPSGLENEQAAQQVDNEQIDTLINMLLGSAEYRRLRATKTPNTLLDQFFEGLLERAPDANAYRTFTGELSRGNDAGVLRTLLNSDEFDDVIAGQSLEASPVEKACMQAVEQRASSDLRRATKLSFLTVATTSGSFFSDEIRGTAKLPDGRGIDFMCTADRMRGAIADTSYRITEAEEQRELMVRCESRDNRRRECPAVTSGGVTLVRQLSRTHCQENVNWGYTEQGIWVDRGCRADFRATELVAKKSLELVGEGTGFLKQADSQTVWFDRAQLECEDDGTARMSFAGQNTVSLAGVCFPFNEERIELGLVPASGGWYTEGGGSVTVAEGALGEISVAGRSRYGKGFTIVFRAGSSTDARDMAQSGEGLLEVADGRRATATAIRIDQESNGRVTISFEGQARFAFTGTWFENWSGEYEVTVDGGLNDTTTRGAGRVRWLDDGSVAVDLVGTAKSVGGAWRVGFKGALN